MQADFLQVEDKGSEGFTKVLTHCLCPLKLVCPEVQEKLKLCPITCRASNHPHSRKHTFCKRTKKTMVAGSNLEEFSGACHTACISWSRCSSSLTLSAEAGPALRADATISACSSHFFRTWLSTSCLASLACEKQPLLVVLQNWGRHRSWKCSKIKSTWGLSTISV